MNMLADLQLRKVVGHVAEAVTAYQEAHARLRAARFWQRPACRRQLREAVLCWHSTRQVLIDVVSIGSLDLAAAERAADDMVAEYIALDLYPVHHTIVCPF